MVRQKTVIRIEGHNPRMQIERSVIRIAREINPSMRSIVHLRKRNKPSITLLSGPHVHKKSRDQYSIADHRSLFVFVIENQHS